MKFKRILGAILAVTTAASSLNTVFSAEPTTTGAEPVIEEAVTSDSALEAVSADTEPEAEEESSSEKVISEEASEPTAEVSGTEESGNNFDEIKIESVQSADFVTLKWTTTYAVANGSLYFDADTGTITYSDQSITSADIPSYIDGTAVTSIGNDAFNNRYYLTSVTIPSSITSIGIDAFYGCSSLTSATISNGVTSIGYGAFYKCFNLTNIRIPSSVASIGNSAFYGCTSLESIVINSGVTSIGSSAFADCTALTSVTIPGSVVSVGGGAFKNCSGLAKVTIREGVTTIGASAFSNCTALSSVTMPSSVVEFKYGGCFYNCALKTAGYIGGDYDYEFSWNDTIPDYAFYSCTSLTSIDIPSNIVSIGNYAFDSCTSLTGIDIPDSVTSIGEYAFQYSGLTSITIPNGVISINEGTFRVCEALTSIYIPSSVTSIGVCAFSSCTSLESIDIPSSVILIGNSAFSSCTSLESIDIPSSVTSIGSYAFEYCSGLTSIDIPNSVTSIGNGAFEYCTRLTNINISSSVTSIGSSAFEYCINLTSIDIPNSVTSIGENAFEYSGLTSIDIPNSVTSIAEGTFEYCAALTSVDIPSSVTSIDGYAFAYCTNLTNIDIPSSVTSIGEYAFAYCSNLASITIPENVTSIGTYTFRECCFETAGPIGGGYDYEFGWTKSIPVRAFQYCSSLTSIIIPDTITSIGNRAFSECYSLTSITIPKSVTSIGLYTFSGGCYFETAGPIGGGYDYEFGWTDTIPSYAFSSCTSLTSITLPDDVALIGNSAFCYCYMLTDLTIPNGLTSIGSYAFEYCSHLESLLIPSSVISFGNNAFYVTSNSNLFLYVIEDSSAEAYAEKNGYSYVSLPELKAESVDYCTGISEALENDEELIVNITFNGEFEIVGGEISVMNEDDEEEIIIYPSKAAAEANDSESYYSKSEDDDNVLTLYIDVVSDESEVVDSFLGMYYHDITLLTYEELKVIIDDTVIKPVDELICEDGVYSGTYFGRQKLSLDLDDYNLDYPEDIFRWKNMSAFFNEKDENHYNISDEFADRINPGIFKSSIITKMRYKNEWGGSCLGMSSLIGLIKNELFDIGNIEGGVTEISKLECPKYSTDVGGVRDWVNYLQLLQYDKNFSKVSAKVYMTDFFSEDINIEGSSEKDINLVLQTIVNIAKAGLTTYTFDFSRLELKKKENENDDDEYVIYGHAMLPFGYYYDEDSEEHKILCYNSSNDNRCSIVTINSDYTDFTVSGYEDTNMIRVGYTNLNKLASRYDLSAAETAEASSVSLSSSDSSSEDNVLWLQSIGDFKISGGGKCLTYDDGILSGDYDIVEDFDIIASDSDSPATLRITLADADSYTVSTETGSLDCTLSTADMFGFSVTKGSGLSVEFDCVNNAVKTEGTISEYSAALAYDEDDTVIINGTDETKVVMANNDEMSVSTESGGEVTLDIINDGEKTDSETISGSDNITVVKNETGLEVSSENTSTETSTEALTEISTETSTEALTETSTEASTEIPTETSTEASPETTTETFAEEPTETTTEGEFVSPPAFEVAGVFGGRNVMFTSETDGAVIYYSSTSSTLTTDDVSVSNGETVLFEDFYGTIYARAYYNGSWSNVARLILKIPVVNTPTVTASGSTVTIKSTTPSSFICYTTDGSEPVIEPDGTVTNGTWLRVNGARTNSGTVTANPGDTVRAVAVRNCFTTSASAAAYVSVSPAAFKVVGTFGGRNVTFTSDTSGAKIYYSSTTSSLTTEDKCVSNGETVLFEDFYGTIYARAYYNGKWSNVSRLILKIPTINDPTITYSGGKATIRTTTPSCYIYYTTDGTTPSVTNGKKLCSNSYGQVTVSSGTKIKAIAVRSCFTNSEVVSYTVS